MSRPDRRTLPLVYSCSGCSSAAQLANHVALDLDRRGLAEMSCIAGVGGGVAPLVRLAQSGRPIVALDGCALACVRHCLAQAGVVAGTYHLLSDYGVRKRYGTDFAAADAERVLATVLATLPAAGAATEPAASLPLHRGIPR